jgi:hypothetical protein
MFSAVLVPKRGHINRVAENLIIFYIEKIIISG